MGGGRYDYDRSVATACSYVGKSTNEIFESRQMNNAMSPFDVKIRESRDSAEHPNSLAIIIALDITGSMGSIPHYMITQGLSNMMKMIMDKGIKDPQVLFLGIGDHTCDQAPLQVGQFESSDDLLNTWLKNIWLEGDGGGNDGESYSLAWYFAAKHTSIDCFEKRQQKGYLFTIGDEKVLPSIPSTALKKIMGSGQYDDYGCNDLLQLARKKYIVKHLHLRQGSNGRREDVINNWQQLVGDDLIIIENRESVSKVMADAIIVQSDNSDLTIDIPDQQEEMML